jgi:ABC-type branched-subunit amino acid transport system ATPase component
MAKKQSKKRSKRSSKKSSKKQTKKPVKKQSKKQSVKKKQVKTSAAKITSSKKELKKTPVKKAPEKKVPVKKAPEKKAPVKKAPEKKVPVKKAPEKKAPVKKAPEKKAPVKKAPEKKVPVKKAPEKKAPVKKAPEKKAQVKKAPVKKAPEKKPLVKKTPVKKDTKKQPVKKKPIKKVKKKPVKKPKTKRKRSRATYNYDNISKNPSVNKRVQITRNPALLRLRSKIIEAIETAETFWLIFKEKSFGMAGFLHFPKKTVYIEIIFYLKDHEKAPFQVISPFKHAIPIKKIKNGISKSTDVSPIDVFQEIQDYLNKEIMKYQDLQDKQLKDIQDRYESYAIHNKPYNRQVHLFYGKKHFWFNIFFTAYPTSPKIRHIPECLKTIRGKAELDFDFDDTWDINKPRPIVDVIQDVDQWVASLLKEEWNEGSQVIIGDKLQIPGLSRDINFRFQRGNSIGVIFQKNEKAALDRLFTALTVNKKIKGGKLIAFGEDITKHVKDHIKWVDISYKKYKKRRNRQKELLRDKNLSKMTVWKAIFKDSMKNTAQYSSADRKKWIKNFLKDLNLEENAKERVKNLSNFEYYRLIIGRTILKSFPSLILLKVPYEIFGRMSKKAFFQLMDTLKEKYHVTFMIAGPQEFLADSDKILHFGLSSTKSEALTMDELMTKLPKGGEIINLLLNQATAPEIKRLKSLKNTILIENREGESYTIFSKTDVDNLIITLFKELGTKIFNYKRKKPSLSEYLEFIDYTKK